MTRLPPEQAPMPTPPLTPPKAAPLPLPPAARPALLSSASAPVPAGTRLAGPSREALARHGGMQLAATGAKIGRPATTAFTRSPGASRRAGAFRPRSVQARAAARGALAPAPQQAAAGAVARTQATKAPAEATNLVQAKAAWLEAAKSFPLARTLLQPQPVKGSLLSGHANIVCENLRILTLPGHNEKWMVTEFDPRTESQAKRRRWALSDQGTFACCLEFLPYHERNMTEEQANYERSRKLNPREARARAEETDEFEADVLQEVQTAALLNRDLEIHGFHRTEDGRLIVIMTDFPEEAFYLSQQLGAEKRAPMAYRMFAEVSSHLHMDLHRKGLVHGDLKLPNIMMTAAGSYTLIDFGNTRSLNAAGVVDEAVCQEATFAPPEFHATGEMGKAGDLWALGYSLVHMFAFGNATDVAASLPKGNLQRDRQLKQFEKNMAAFDLAARNGTFEPLRAELAAARDPLATLEQLTRRVPYLSVLVPLARGVPELYAISMASLLARDPALRRDALEARSLGQKLLVQHKEAIAKSRLAEAEILGASASVKFVEPDLRQIAEAEEFLPVSAGGPSSA